MKVELTEQAIRSLKATERLDLWDSKVTGLVLRATPNGVKTWGLWYRFNGQRRRYTLGSWKREDTRGKGLPLAAARREAEGLLAEIRLGRDPQAGRLQARIDEARRVEEEQRLAVAGGPLTVERLVRGCLAAITLSPKTGREWHRLAEVEIIPTLGVRPAADLTKPEVREWSRAIVARSHYTANRAFEVLRRAYSWALGEDLVTTMPFLGLNKPGTEEQSDRVLSADEIRTIWRALDELVAEAAGPKPKLPKRTAKLRARERIAYIDAVRLLFLTGTRRDMVLGAKRGEFEGLEGKEPRWTVPGGFAGRSKSGRPHVVPLSAMAADIVRRRVSEVSGEALFPVTRRGAITNGDPNAPMTWSSRFVAELRDRADTLFVAELKDQRRTASAIPRWTIHNIRHAVGTHLREDLGVSSEVVSLILGHTPPGPRVSRTYNRAELLPERQAALVAWAEWLKRVASGKNQGARIMPMKSRRR